MNTKYLITLSSCLLLLIAGWIPAAAQSAISDSDPAPLSARDVSGELAVHDAGIFVRDVTEEYSRYLAGGRSGVDFYFMSAFGHAGADCGQEGILTSDGGGLAAGYYINPSGFSQFLIVKLSHQGEVEWARIAGDGWTFGYDVLETSDGGFLVAGRSDALGAGGNDIYLVKFSSSGTPLWSRAVGGSGNDGAYSVCETADGSIVAAGYTDSFGAGGLDALLVKLDSGGTVQWSTVVGGEGDDGLYSIELTADGGFIGAGETWSYGAGFSDALLIRFTDNGALLWGAALGGEFSDTAKDVIEASNGDFVLTGQTTEGPGGSAVLFAIFDADGSLTTATAVGGAPNGDHGNAICELADGGYAVAGATYNFGAGNSDAFLVTFDSSGAYQWARVFGGPGPESANSVQGLPGGGFFVTGETSSFGQYDGVLSNVLLVVADRAGLVPGCEYGVGCYPDVEILDPAVIYLEPTITSPALSEESPPINWALIYWPNLRVCDYTPPEKEYWLVASGDIYTDSGQAIGQTSDGGFLVAAGAGGYMVDTATDVLLLKYDPAGALQWASVAGGFGTDMPRDLVVTGDDGCIVTGYTLSFGVSSYDAMVFSFDAAGNLNWAKTVGGPGTDSGRSIRETPAGEFLVAGGTEDVTSGNNRVLAFAIDITGDVQWIRTVGSADYSELAYCGIGTPDGGTLLAGSVSYGNKQSLAIKLDAAGDLDWYTVVGSGGDDFFNSIVTLPDGDYVLGGQTTSYGSSDAFFIKFDGTTLARQWVRSAGSANNEYFYDMRGTLDGGIIAVGYVYVPSSPYTHALLGKFDGDGVPLWSHALNGKGYSEFLGVTETADGGIAAAGTTTAFGAGNSDVFAVHTDRNGRVGDCPFVWPLEFESSLQYPPGGGTTLTAQTPVLSIYTQSPATANPAVIHEEICSALPTVGGTFSCTPDVGTAPFVTSMRAELINNYDGITRRMAAQITFRLPNGTNYPNWRAGFTNIGPGEAYIATWNQSIPALPRMDGESRFTLLAEDVTPAPYNQPPYPPSGDSDTDVFQMRVTVP